MTKTIQIVLLDEALHGIRIAEVKGHTTRTIAVPRKRLREAASRPELHKPGLYILLGPVAEDSKPVAYIGETENCFVRLKQHDSRLEFWSSAVLCTSRTDDYTKADIKFLEWAAFKTAIDAGRFELKNGNIPTRPHLPEFEEDNLQQIFSNIKLLVSALGYSIFDPFEVRPDDTEVFHCSSGDGDAKGTYTDEGFVVFKDSKAAETTRPAADKHVGRIREKLIELGVLIPGEECLVFTEDYLFNSPSGAAVAVIGNNANGWTAWKDWTGRTLDSVYREDSAGDSAK